MNRQTGRGGGASFDYPPIINVGDRVTFRAVCRWNDRTATRKVIGFYTVADTTHPLVRFGGYAEFIVRPNEITDVIPAS